MSVGCADESVTALIISEWFWIIVFCQTLSSSAAYFFDLISILYFLNIIVWKETPVMDDKFLRNVFATRTYVAAFGLATLKASEADIYPEMVHYHLQRLTTTNLSKAAQGPR